MRKTLEQKNEARMARFLARSRTCSVPEGEVLPTTHHIGQTIRSLTESNWLVGEYEPKTYVYAITIKPTLDLYKKQVQKEPKLLEEFFIKLMHDHGLLIHEMYTELDSKNLPHIHGTVIKEELPIYNRIWFTGYKIHYEVVQNPDAWCKYIKKDQPKDDQPIKNPWLA